MCVGQDVVARVRSCRLRCAESDAVTPEWEAQQPPDAFFWDADPAETDWVTGYIKSGKLMPQFTNPTKAQALADKRRRMTKHQLLAHLPS